MSINSNALSIQWGSLVDLANDVKPFLQVESSDTSSDAVLERLIDGISDWVQREVGRPLAKSSFTKKFDADGFTSTLFLPYCPVLEVTSVIEYWGVSGPHTLTEQSPTNQVDGFQVDYPTGALTRVFQGLVPKPWFPGQGNIIVAWDAGFNPVPASVTMATLEAIKWYWDNTQQQARSGPMGAVQSQEGWARPDVSQFWGSVVPALLKPVIDPFVQVGIG